MNAVTADKAPDLDLAPANRPLRVFTLLHDARPVLLNLGESGGFDVTPWADRVQLIDAKCVGTWELPAIGAVTAPHRHFWFGLTDVWPGWETETQMGLADALTNHLVRSAYCGAARRLPRSSC
jgi:hypothetical protein